MHVLVEEARSWNVSSPGMLEGHTGPAIPELHLFLHRGPKLSLCESGLMQWPASPPVSSGTPMEKVIPNDQQLAFASKVPSPVVYSKVLRGLRIWV